MQFIEDLSIFHVNSKEIPCIAASGAPDGRYPGAPGVLYMDRRTGGLYLCTDADATENTYTWQIVGGADPAAIQQSVSKYLAEHPASGGITPAAAALLITILQNAAFITNQTGNIAALQNALTGGEEVPDVPTEPAADEITVEDGVMTIISVGSEISLSDGIMTIA